MADYKTPGVYVEEISKFPPSVAGVATAIPAFIGFTETCPKDKKNVPVKVTSMVDFESKFGVGPELKINNDKLENQNYVLYDSMRLFYDNGGGTCYVVSVGDYKDTPSIDSYTGGPTNTVFNNLEKVDEVTLVLFPDAALLLKDETELGSVQQQALKHCKEMGDRFAILDLYKKKNLDESLEGFRNSVGANYLDFGAAYFPHLKTTYTKEISFDEMIKHKDVKKCIEEDETLNSKIDDYIIVIDYSMVISNVKSSLKQKEEKSKEIKKFTVTDEDKLQYNETDIDIDQLGEAVIIYNEIVGKKSDENTWEKAINEVKSLYDNAETLLSGIDNYEIKEDVLYNKNTNTAVNKASESLSDLETILLDEMTITANAIEESKSQKKLIAKALKKLIPNYAEVEAELQAQAQVITPSAAIAGIYTAIDNNKGVWQAPANVSIASVANVDIQISDREQEDMNVDANAGKSVNAIRSFAGKGVLVWGARTLDGNSNEWRYVSVRRLYNYIEESVQKSTSWAVFQPNDANTWVKIKCQIENFLSNLWRDGALAGSTPEKAFFVNVGQDITMSAQDILEGRLIVEIGLAAVRPAEFIILKFSHKLQEA